MKMICKIHGEVDSYLMNDNTVMCSQCVKDMIQKFIQEELVSCFNILNLEQMFLNAFVNCGKYDVIKSLSKNNDCSCLCEEKSSHKNWCQRNKNEKN